MNKNRYFANNPTGLTVSRSRFNRASQHKTTLNTGDLVPIYVDEILPGDTVTMDMSALVRMSTPIFPVMDNAYIEFFWFFVPNRLLWKHWKEFMGENTETYWTNPDEYTVPKILIYKKGEGGLDYEPVEKGSILDYMGVPTGVGGGTVASGTAVQVNALPVRAYCLIWNEWFRDQNTTQPVLVNNGDSGGTYYAPSKENYTEVQHTQYGGRPLKVCKPFDYFTGALPQPQKGEPVTLPLSGLTVPVIGNGKALGLTTVQDPTQENQKFGLVKAHGGTYLNTAMNAYGSKLPGAGTGNDAAADKDAYIGVTPSAEESGLIANISEVTAVNINQLRQAFAVQRMLERDARGGTRYTEIIRSHFGVISPDARQQRPEYLGGCKKLINVDQVVQTSSTDSVTPQGNTAAVSVTGVRDNKFTKSFTEHGWLMGLACIRTDHTYQQGLERFWNRKLRTDYYFPVFANLGEQAILNKEIYLQGTAQDSEAFGYQEAWADYRYKPNRVSGAMRSNYAQTLDSWHYADYYKALPTLSSDWIKETRENVDRTIAVSEQLEDQFIADFYFNCIMTRPMPLYSIPGLIDHH